jgi:uncharacterized protein (DUF2147 family)
MNERATMQICNRYFLAFILLPILLGPAAAAEPPAASPVGEWLVNDGSAKVRIVSCGDSLWGSISWAKNPGMDENNPDPAKRGRSVIGMPILLNMKKTEPDRWEGEVYNAENGKTYTSNISLAEDDVLRIEGCVFGGLFCGGEDWTRVTPSKDGANSGEPAKDICPPA